MALRAWTVLVIAIIAIGCSAKVETPARGAATTGTSGQGAATGSTGAMASSTGSSSSGSSSSGSSSSGSSSTGSAGSTGACNSGEPMPSSNPPGWTLAFADDFNTDAPLGAFPGAPGTAYGDTWAAYPDAWHDTSGNGQYSPERTLSVKDGCLTIDVHTENGIHLVAAPEPMKGAGQLYGRYSVRFRATRTTNDYKTAWLLWPDSDLWPADGEIDFPEGNLASTIEAFAHHASPSGGQDAFSTSTPYTGWHTATTEWAPGAVTFFLDGAQVGRSTTLVPSKPMHFVLQTETNLDGVVPSDTSVGELQIDWIAIWARS